MYGRTRRHGIGLPGFPSGTDWLRFRQLPACGAACPLELTVFAGRFVPVAVGWLPRGGRARGPGLLVGLRRCGFLRGRGRRDAPGRACHWPSQVSAARSLAFCDGCSGGGGIDWIVPVETWYTR